MWVMWGSHRAHMKSSVLQAACSQETVQRTPGCRVKIPTQHHRIGRPVRQVGQAADLGQQDGELGQFDVTAARIVEEVSVGNTDEGRRIRLSRGGIRPQQDNKSHIVPVEDGFTGAEELDRIRGKEGEAGRLEDDGTAIWFISCSLLKLTVVT